MATNDDGGKTPAGTKPQFNAAREGGVSEPVQERFTPEQQKAADKRAAILSGDNVNEADLQSIDGRIEFNVRSEDQPSNKSHVHQKSETAKETYTSKVSGMTYEGDAAISAAKRLDKDHDNDVKQRTENAQRGHHAPALTMPGGPTDKNRGKTASLPSQQNDKSSPQSKELSERTQRLKAASEKRLEQQQGMEATQSNNKDMER